MLFSGKGVPLRWSTVTPGGPAGLGGPQRVQGVRELRVRELAGVLLRAAGHARRDGHQAEGVPPLAEVGQAAASQTESKGCEEEEG